MPTTAKLELDAANGTFKSEEFSGDKNVQQRSKRS